MVREDVLAETLAVVVVAAAVLLEAWMPSLEWVPWSVQEVATEMRNRTVIHSTEVD
jgi:hypothetical protein